MPHETNFFDKGVHWQFSGAVPFSEFIAANGEVWGLPEWESLRFQVVDLLNADAPSITQIEAENFVHFDEPAALSVKSMRIAYVAKHPEWTALAQSYIDNLSIPGWQARTFDGLDDALSWARSN